MSDLLVALKQAEEYYWSAMELVEGDGIYRVRCRHCQMVRDIAGKEDPKKAFRDLEHYARKCAVVNVAVQIRKAVKSDG